MILQLILKDLKAYQVNIFFRILILWLFFGALFIFRYYSWDVYMMHSCMAISFASSFFSFFEKKRNIEIFTCSLPVSRFQIVFGRYLTSVFITIIGLGIWLFFASLADFIYDQSGTLVQQIYNGKVITLAILFVVIHISIFLPAFFAFRIYGSIFTFIIAISISVYSIAVFFRPYSSHFNFSFEITSILSVLLLMIIVLLPSISASLSVLIYKRKDL